MIAPNEIRTAVVTFNAALRQVHGRAVGARFALPRERLVQVIANLKYKDKCSHFNWIKVVLIVERNDLNPRS